MQIFVRPRFTAHKYCRQSVVYTTLTTTFDATPFTTVPSGISSLPTGVFGLPITTPSIQEQDCIMDTTQSVAWNCQIPPALPYQMNINRIPSASELTNNEITLDFGNNTVDFLPYGAQPPVLTETQVLGLVTDSQNPDRGPAWFFQVPYNKVVILPDEALAAPSSNSKRQNNGRRSRTGAFMERKGVAMPGDAPWFCYWNDTLLETFIYVDQISSWGRAASSLSSSCTTTATPTRGYGGSATSTGSSSAQTSMAQASSYSDSVASGDPEFLGLYPRVVKVEERRIPRGSQSISPYCKFCQHRPFRPYIAINVSQVFSILSMELESPNQP